MSPRPTDARSPEPVGTALGAALHAPGPDPGYADKLMLFGQFVGSWHGEWSGYDTNASPAHLTGEVHFGWVLGGRAVQDTWIVPARRRTTDSTDKMHGTGRAVTTSFHGTTIRFYDPSIDAWRSTWIDPPNGRIRRFIARPVGAEIILLSDEEQPHLCWRFTDITPRSFHWRAEISHDAGATWAYHQDMTLTRTAT